MADFLFTQFSQQNIRSGTDQVQTSGRAALGQFPATYVADSQATAALFAAHPRFVGQSSNGRYFRALPEGGSLAVELGGALGDGIANDQPAIQAAIAYAEAVGIKTVAFAARDYRLFCPVRTSEPAGAAAEHHYDGHPIVITRPLVLRSIRHGGSRLVFRHVDGTERTTGYQLITSPSTGQPTVWRGGGIFVQCPPTAPANPADRPGITLEDLTLDGGIARSAYYSWPARAADGDGWDITDKGIWIEGDRHSGDIRLSRCTITGFRGELIYQAGRNTGELVIRDCILSETNGNLIQATCSNCDIDGLTGLNAFQAFEGWGGRRGRIVNAVFEDCVQTGGLAGGTFSAGSFNNAPTRLDDMMIPWLTIQAQFRNCGSVRLGSWVRGSIGLTDSYLMLEASNLYAQGLRNVELDVMATVDKSSGQTPVMLVGSITPGQMALSDVRIRLSCHRTDEARANGRIHTQPVSYWGSIGPNVVIERSSGEARRASGPAGNPLTDVPDNIPCFRNNRFVRLINDWAATIQDVSAAPQIIPRGDLMAVHSPTPGTWPITMPTSGIGHGHELTIRNTSGLGSAISIAASGAGAALPARRTIAPGGRIALRFDAEIGLWLEVASPAPLKGSATLAVAAIAAGGLSSEISVPCPGAAPGMAVTIVPAADPGADLEVCAARAASDQVRFRLRNLGSAAATPATVSWTAAAAYPT